MVNPRAERRVWVLGTTGPALVFLAVVVGSIVTAMFLPILGIITGPGIGTSDTGDS